MAYLSKSLLRVGPSGYAQFAMLLLLLLLLQKAKTLYILELTIGFETNIKVHSDRKALNYNLLHHSLRSTYRQINFINSCLGTLGTVGSSSDSVSELLKANDFYSKLQKAILSRIMYITTRCTYYIFCCRNKPWTSPKLHGT